MKPVDDKIENESSPKESKKAQILALFTAGIKDIKELALMTQSRPSYVASVLQRAGLITGYFDLYTNSAHPMNIYSRAFAGKLGFKDELAARRSIRYLDHLYTQFERVRDRAGQHHALVMALTLCDRARWCGKTKQARVFSDWLVVKLRASEQFADQPEVITQTSS